MSEDKGDIYKSSKSRDTRDDSNLLNPARIYATPKETRYLDPTELAKLEHEFRSWVETASRLDVIASRKRILLLFLLIRYTGARLSEVLTLDLRKHLDAEKLVVRFGNVKLDNSPEREVQISPELLSEIKATIEDHDIACEVGWSLKIDAGHVRRKFYERASACGFAKDLGAPNAIRRARGVELMRDNMPLPVVQRILGHSSPNLTASFVSFSDEDINQVARHFVERESKRKTSARNSFFGKIRYVRKGDIQSQIELITIAGDVVTTVITNNSLNRMGLKPGSLITAEVKAPWVILEKAINEPSCSAENIYRGAVSQIVRGKLTTEFIVRLQDGTEICSLVTDKSRRKLDVKQGDDVWAMFNSFAVILHVP
ncbi:MAG: TOBE domain-containing protein [Pseudomonadota bacterium]